MKELLPCWRSTDLDVYVSTMISKALVLRVWLVYSVLFEHKDFLLGQSALEIAR